MNQVRSYFLKLSALLIVGLLMLGCIPLVALGGSMIGGRAGNVPVVVQNTTTANPSTIIPGQLTVISTPFTHADQLAPSAFNITFKAKSDKSGTEYAIVSNATTGSGNLKVVQNQTDKTKYIASVNWTPPVDQTLGTYCLYFYVNDSKNHAEDACVNNPHKLLIVAPAAIPIIVPGSTNANPKVIQALGNYKTVISVNFTDTDHPDAGTFKVTFKVRDQGNNIVTLVSASKTGINGLLVKQVGSASSTSYFANYTWDPADNQTIGSYCLYSRVEDAHGAAEDSFSSNCNELTLTKPSAPPVIQSGATKAQPSSITRNGPETTTISTNFTHADLPPVTDFTVTFQVRSDKGTIYTLANNKQNGYGCVNIIYFGQGNYQASCVWDPNETQPTGKYDLYISITDSHGHTASDLFDSNVKELMITKKPAIPHILAGVTTVTPSTVNIFVNGTTTLTTKFTDSDMPAVDQFKVSFKVRDVGNVEYKLVDAQVAGYTGLTVSSDSKGNYTASYVWKPSSSQPLSCYALYSAVEDPNGVMVADDFDNNLCELTLIKSAVTGNGTIKGVVKDFDGKTIAGATVEIRDANNHVKIVTTAADGSYSTTVAAGTYSVVAIAPNFFSKNQTDIKVTKDQTTQVTDFKLINKTSGGPKTIKEVTPTYIFGLIVLLVVIIVILCLLLVMGMGKEPSGSTKGPRSQTHRHERVDDDVEPDHPIESREEKEIENEPKPIPISRVRIEKLKDKEPEEEETEEKEE